jgi:hypothetical protein
MLGPYIYFSAFITQIYSSNNFIINYNVYTNDLFNKFTIQRLFFFIGLGFLGICLPNLIVDIPITYYDGLLVTYSYQDYNNYGYKYRFIRT